MSLIIMDSHYDFADFAGGIDGEHALPRPPPPTRPPNQTPRTRFPHPPQTPSAHPSFRMGNVYKNVTAKKKSGLYPRHGT